MALLYEFTKLMRSKNAGPFQLTIDVMMERIEDYEHVVGANVLTPKVVGDLMGVEPQLVEIFFYKPGLAIKITLPRPVSVGDPDDDDLFGGQMFGPLVELEIPSRPN